MCNDGYSTVEIGAHRYHGSYRVMLEMDIYVAGGSNCDFTWFQQLNDAVEHMLSVAVFCF